MFKCVSAIESLDHSKKRRQLISFCSTLLSTGCWRIPWPWLFAIQWFRFFQFFVPVIETDKVPKLRWKLTLSLIYFGFFLLSILVWWEDPCGVMFTPIRPAAQQSSVFIYFLLGGSPIAPCLFLLCYCRVAGNTWVRQSLARAGTPPSVKLLF